MPKRILNRNLNLFIRYWPSRHSISRVNVNGLCISSHTLSCSHNSITTCKNKKAYHWDCQKKFHITGITDLTSSTTPLVNPATVLHELKIKFSDNKTEINRIFIKDPECSFLLYYSRYQHTRFLRSHPWINHSSGIRKTYQYRLKIKVFW